MTPEGETKPSWAFAVAGLVLLVPAMIWSAWVLSVLWGWFVCPLGVPPINLSAAIGVRLVAQSLCGRAPEYNPPSSFERQVHSVVTWVIFPASLLLVGWIVR